jgi:hypothetical protein
MDFIEEIYKYNNDKGKHISKIILHPDFYYNLINLVNTFSYMNMYLNTIVGIPFEINSKSKSNYIFEYKEWEELE